MKYYGIIGYPLTHSFSQHYFTEKFKQNGIIDCRYDNYPIGSVNELPVLLQQNPEIDGLNITIPYKQSVLPFIDDKQNIPLGINACNCIKIKAGKIYGYNTDVIGFELSILPLLKEYHNSALILGNGGAAEAVKFVFKKLNIPFKTVSRKIHQGSDLTYDKLDEKLIRENTLIINTTPLGTSPAIDECPAIPYQYLSDKHLLYDLVYNPTKTLFLKKGEEQEAIIKNGYEMLVLQAEESWRIWNED